MEYPMAISSEGEYTKMFNKKHVTDVTCKTLFYLKNIYGAAT